MPKKSMYEESHDRRVRLGITQSLVSGARARARSLTQVSRSHVHTAMLPTACYLIYFRIVGSVGVSAAFEATNGFVIVTSARV